MGNIGLRSRKRADREGRGSYFVIEQKSNIFKGKGRVGVGEQLLPGIPNEITLDLVVPKLLWTDFRALSSVSRVWQQAIRSHEVCDARVRTQSTQKFAYALLGGRVRAESFPSRPIIEGSCYSLPPIPGVKEIFPLSCRCRFLDGRVYILGGFEGSRGNLENCAELFVLGGRSTSHLLRASAKVYMLDFAGQRRQWKQCARMANRRAHFGCGVLNGLIYVFGGISSSKFGKPIYRSYGSEVYDPESDTWSSIAPKEILRLYQKGVSMGGELFVKSEFSDRDYETLRINEVQVSRT